MSTTDFTELQPFIAQWGLASAHDRLHKRMSANMDDLRAFHSAMVPRLEEIIEFLNQFPVDDIPAEHQPLAHAALSVCEVDDAVQIWNAPTLGLSSDARTWRVNGSFYDYR